MQDDPADDAAGRVEHHADEQQAEIKQPDAREVGQGDLQAGDDHGADDRAGECAGPANIGHEQRDARMLRAELLRVHDFEIDRREPAGEAGEKGRHAEGDETQRPRRIADEFGPLRVVAHGVAHAPERRPGERVHRERCEEAPRRNEIIDLDLRSEVKPEERRQPERLAVMPSSPPKNVRSMNELDDTSSPMPSEIIAKDDARPAWSKRGRTGSRSPGRARPPMSGTIGKGTPSWRG